MWESQTTITLPTEARDRLAQLKREDESWNDTVHRVADELEGAKADGGDRQ